ncbi:putative lipoprotein [Metapseudomonas furukawaii]|uniref:Lipoprotein n=2 Tax=Metapseudomonas furukawaii TaxID=1149133 RepID=A0AAD1C198_METFU|nr:putative lipoprotein [Pseudomonas furukawaii]BAU74910.1 putative lipoprotein [Pseudomonas furukawaii]
MFRARSFQDRRFMTHYASRFAILAALLALAACGTQGPRETVPTPSEVRAKLVRLIPAKVPDRQGWAADIQAAFTARDIAPSDSNLCAVLAVIEQESTYQVDPPVPGLGRIARDEIQRRAGRLHVPALLVNAALGLKSPNGKTYQQRLAGARTEKELSAIFDDFIGMVPLGQRLFGTFNPVHTGGPMQVSIAFAEANAREYPYPVSGTVRQEVFTRRGGLYFGIAHLLGYPAHYSKPLYRFADFNAGWYASRNAAFQQAVSRVSGIELALDGDLVIHGSSKAGATELAVRALKRQLDMSDSAIRRDLLKGDSLDFEETDLHERVFALADRQQGRRQPREAMPGIDLKSPKITRKLTTAWFATRVDGRYQNCLKRAGAR